MIILEWAIIVVFVAFLLVVGKFALWLFKDFFDALDTQKIGDKSVRVLIFGFSELSFELAKLFENHNIDYLQIENEAQLGRDVIFTHLVALSESDLDNLTISRIAERIINIRFQFIMCNEFRNDKVFQNNGMPYFHKKELSAYEILRQMFPLIEE